MPTVSRTRSVPAAPEEVWRVVSDPQRLADWWPGVQRVEDATEDTWTKVLRSARGKVVRADYSRVEAEPPRRMLWRHEVDESPFEAILSDSLIEIVLEPEDQWHTRVRLRMEQKLRGSYRLGGWMMRRATRRQLDEALDGLERAVGAT